MKVKKRKFSAFPPAKRQTAAGKPRNGCGKAAKHTPQTLPRFPAVQQKTTPPCARSDGGEHGADMKKHGCAVPLSAMAALPQRRISRPNRRHRHRRRHSGRRGCASRPKKRNRIRRRGRRCGTRPPLRPACRALG